LEKLKRTKSLKAVLVDNAQIRFFPFSLLSARMA